MSAQQHLIQVPLATLHPTQITVGNVEVAAKRSQWAALDAKARERTLAGHWFPAVRGPGGRYFIVDHHHLGLALDEEGVESVWVMLLDDLSAVEGEQFWRAMEFHRWAHPYDERGRRRDYAAIPSRVSKLRNDPYRSLAGLVRKAGGYAKDAAPFAEFLWADFFRLQITRKKLRPTPGAQALPAETLQQALALARQPNARYLPGWAGVTTPGTATGPATDTATGATAKAAKAAKSGKPPKKLKGPKRSKTTKPAA